MKKPESKHEEVLLECFTYATRRMLSLGERTHEFKLIGRTYMAVVVDYKKNPTRVKVALMKDGPTTLLGHLIVTEEWKPLGEKNAANREGQESSSGRSGRKEKAQTK